MAEEAAAESNGSLRTVRLASGAGTTFGVDDIAIAWAHSGGFWKEEGLDIHWTPVRGGVKAAEAVLAGDVDGAYGTWVPVVAKRLEGAPLRVLSSMAQSLAQNLLVDRSSISCLDDLRGKKWAVDGIGALSHTLGQLIAQGLGMDDDIEWVVAGPPPQRIEKLLTGEVDCSLVRVEEAAVLARQYPEKLDRLLGFDEILPLAPIQPHGVISVSEAFVEEKPDICLSLVRGLVRASRSLHDSFEAFHQAVKDHVTERPPALGPAVDVSEEELLMIWNREHAAGSFAVNGGLTVAHWEKSLAVFATTYKDPRATQLTLSEFAALDFLAEALDELGVHENSSHDQPPPGKCEGQAAEGEEAAAERAP